MITWERMYRVIRRFACLAGSGMLFQASGCSVDTQSLVTDVTNTVLNAFLQYLQAGLTA
jgi:hypothetical protein